MKKKSLYIILITIMLGSISYAQMRVQVIERYYRDIIIKLNGKEIITRDATGKVVEPFIIDGTTYLPIRGIGEALDLEVEWDENSNTVILNKKETKTEKDKSINTDSKNEVKAEEKTKSSNVDTEVSENNKTSKNKTKEENKVSNETINKEKSKSGEDNTSIIGVEIKNQTKNDYEFHSVEKIEKYMQTYNNTFSGDKYDTKNIWWRYANYLKLTKDGIITDVYYENGRISIKMGENITHELNDLSTSKKSVFDETLYRYAKIGEPSLTMEDISNIMNDLYNSKYNSESVKNSKKIGNVIIKYYSLNSTFGKYYSAEVEFDF